MMKNLGLVLIVYGINFTSIFAESSAPTFSCHSGLTPQNEKSVLISTHKAIRTSYFYDQGDAHTPNPEKAFDGDENTSTGGAGNISLDLGDDYVVDSAVVKFSGSSTKYAISVSPYKGKTKLPPTYDLTSGLGIFPTGEVVNQEFRNILWVLDAKKNDERKLPPTPCRFMNFGFHPVYNGGWSTVGVNEILVFGHLFKPNAQDEVYLNRGDWKPTAYADGQPGGEGQTVTFAMDGNYTNRWRPNAIPKPGDWYQIDLGKEETFNQINVVFNLTPLTPINQAIDVFATNDLSNWGQPISKMDYRDSVTATFPTQKKRYLKVAFNTTAGGWWEIDEINLLATYDPNAVVGLAPKQIPTSFYSNTGAFKTKFNLLGRLNFKSKETK